MEDIFLQIPNKEYRTKTRQDLFLLRQGLAAVAVLPTPPSMWNCAPSSMIMLASTLNQRCHFSSEQLHIYLSRTFRTLNDQVLQ
jgi:hypothetical protein